MQLEAVFPPRPDLSWHLSSCSLAESGVIHHPPQKRAQTNGSPRKIRQSLFFVPSLVSVSHLVGLVPDVCETNSRILPKELRQQHLNQSIEEVACGLKRSNLRLLFFWTLSRVTSAFQRSEANILC